MPKSVWQRTIVTDTGDVIPGAEVEVFFAGTQDKPDLFQDRDGQTAQANPATADTEGFVRFYVSGGLYDIVASGAGATLTWENVALGTAQFRDTGTAPDEVPLNSDLGSAATEDASVSPTPDTLAKRDGSGRLTSEPGGSGNEVATFTDLDAIDLDTPGLFVKENKTKVAFAKTGNFSVELSQDLQVEVAGTVYSLNQGQSITMPSTPSAGTDIAIWIEPDGTLRASENFTATGDIASGSRQLGGFHYAPGGNASFSLNAGDGDTTPQINQFSFYDLKWKPSVIDPRGLTLVGDGAFWCGIYHLAGDHLAGPPHRHGVNPARDGNPPNLVDGSGNYPDAQPMNIFESLWYHGFRTPRVEDFQLLAFGTNEEASRGSDPGTTGLPGGSTDAQFTSHWGVIQSTGVIRVWSNDSILSDSDQTLPNPSRGDRFRVVRFAALGGNWGGGSRSGSRDVGTSPATNSSTIRGGRGVCDHVILD